MRIIRYFEELIYSDAISIIEWPERALNLLPSSAIIVKIEKTGENEYQVKLPEMEVESEQTEEQGSKLSIDEKRKIRNMYLRKSDKYVLPDFPISSSDLKLAKQYRVYLRDFFEDLKFAENNDIKTFEEYKETLLK